MNHARATGIVVDICLMLSMAAKNVGLKSSDCRSCRNAGSGKLRDSTIEEGIRKRLTYPRAGR